MKLYKYIFLILQLIILILILSKKNNLENFYSSKKNCIVTLTNSSYLLGNILLNYSLKKKNLNTDFIVIYNSLSDMDLKILNSYGIKTLKKKNIPNPYAKNRFTNVFMKLHCWDMTDYERVIFIDNDIINLKNFEHLFKKNMNHNEISIAKDNGFINTENFNTGFFMIKPSSEIYEDLLNKLDKKIKSYDSTDQGFLNTYFKNKIITLDDNYNLLKRRKNYDLNKITNLHYVGVPKPWSDQGEKGYEEYNNLWITAFTKCVDEFWKKKLNPELSELNKIVYNGKNNVEGNLFYQHNKKNVPEHIWYEAETKRHKLYNIVKNKKNVLEIGVNGGHSALLMLKNNPNLNYYGFDINMHSYTQLAINYLKKKYKIQYIIGDSEETIPKFQNMKFDVIHIDGGHTVEKARADIINCKRLADNNTILIFDDTNKNGNICPKLLELWNKLISEKIIKEIEEMNTSQQDWDNKIGKYIF